MKRYRVWEANRKVFLLPENWLEPELRDDQSPFFKETMSELLQSDITEDARRDRAAQLPVEARRGRQARAVRHPLRRERPRNAPTTSPTSSPAPPARSRKYYYRRRECGYWTPWEQIKLDIEDNPVIPVVWKGRLFLFWLQDPEADAARPDAMPPTSSDDAAGRAHARRRSSRTPRPRTSNAKVTVKAMLCWSEYYNGKWQPAKTSDVEPARSSLATSTAGAGAFDRSQAAAVGLDEESDALRIVDHGDQARRCVRSCSTTRTACRCARSDVPAPSGPTPAIRAPRHASATTLDRSLLPAQDSGRVSPDADRPMLKNERDRDRVVEPRTTLAERLGCAVLLRGQPPCLLCHHDASSRCGSPQWDGYDLGDPAADACAEIPPLVSARPDVGPSRARSGRSATNRAPASHDPTPDRSASSPRTPTSDRASARPARCGSATGDRPGGRAADRQTERCRGGRATWQANAPMSGSTYDERRLPAAGSTLCAARTPSSPTRSRTSSTRSSAS